MENRFFPHTPNPNKLAHDHIAWGGEYFVDDKGNRLFLKAKTIEEVGESLSSFRHDGYTSLHLPVSWKKMEPTRKEYSEDYLSQLDAVIEEAKRAHVYAFLDFDLSFPDWTYDMLGFDLNTLAEHESFALKTMQGFFFNGESLSPRVQFEGRYADQYLQRAYAQFIRETAKRQKGKKHVLGYHLENNPNMGILNYNKITQPLFQEIIRADGFGSIKRAWKDDTECVFRSYGVWKISKKGKPKIVDKAHFARSKSRNATSNAGKIFYKGKWHSQAMRALKSVSDSKLISLQKVTTNFDKLLPYPISLCGRKHKFDFNAKKRIFKLSYKKDRESAERVSIFIPKALYKDGFIVSFTSGKCKFDKENSILHHYPGGTKDHKLVIKPMLPADPKEARGLVPF